MAWNNNSDNEGGGNTETSVYNEAAMQIQRLHFAWVNCHSHRTSGELLKWRWELEYIWSELSSDARRIDSNDWNNNCFNVTISSMDKLISMCTGSGNAKRLYSFLDRKEKYLKHLQDQSGKGGSYRGEEEDI